MGIGEIIMWNENAPLELLKELPDVLNDANLARIQSVIDYDKLINSSEYGYDLCGSYAPFCTGCDKSLNHPCAVSYVKMKQAQGYNVAIENVPVEEEVVKMEEVKQEQEPAKEEVKKAPKKIRVAVAKRKTNK